MEKKILDIFNSLSLPNVEIVDIKPKMFTPTLANGRKELIFNEYELTYRYFEPKGNVLGGTIMINKSLDDEGIKKVILEGI